MLNNNSQYKQLLAHRDIILKTSINTLFAQDQNRFNKFSVQLDDILVDFSKQHISDETIKLLLAMANDANLKKAIEALFSGDKVNITENRAALHTELRNPHTKFTEVTNTLEQMNEFVTMVHDNEYTDVIVLGIGGSDLGPRLVCQALLPYKIANLNLHFVANVDSDTLRPLLDSLDKDSTLCLVNSKTFTTIETLANASIVRDWFGNIATKNIYAITASPDKAHAMGFAKENIFTFWDWVGGRYSVWSAVGLPIALSIGMDNFMLFLHGAYAMDQHFITSPDLNNIPILMGLIGIWNIDFLQYSSLCIQPYADALGLLPQYLQQLDMESNGKSVSSTGMRVPYNTAPVIWGGVGCDAQHAYMQMLHQGTQIVPIDFLLARNNHQNDTNLQDLLIASALGQSKALFEGIKDVPHKECTGNRPSTTIMFDTLNPELLGKLLALYEHKVYVQGVIWQIQSFDQWGVQLGKELTKDILHKLQDNNVQDLDSSTLGLLQSYKSRHR